MIRVATLEDAAALAAVEVGALLAGADAGSGGDTADVPAIVEEVGRWRALLGGAGAGWTLAADADGTLVGLVTTAPVTDDAAAISLLCVLPDRWGEGVGAELLEAALASLRRRGLDAVSLQVPSGDERLRALLIHAGFAEAADAPAGPVPEGAGGGEDTVGYRLAL